jgi:hypothetical protein
MQGLGFKGIMVRLGWLSFMVSLALPFMSSLPVDDQPPQVIGGIQFVIQLLVPSWSTIVPFTLLLGLGNLVMLASIAFAGITLRQRARNWWFGIPVLLTGLCGLGLCLGYLHERALIGSWFWVAGMLLCGISALSRQGDGQESA